MRLSTPSDDAGNPRRRTARRRADSRPSIRSAFGIITALGPTRSRGAHTAAIPVITPSVTTAARSRSVADSPASGPSVAKSASVAAPSVAASTVAGRSAAGRSVAEPPVAAWSIGRRRHQVTLAVAGISFGLVASLTTALPTYAAHADTAHTAASTAQASVSSSHQTKAQVQNAALRSAILAAAEKGDVQTLDVSESVATPAVEKATFATVDVVANLENTYGIDATYAQQLIGASNANGRAAIIATALTYLGDPYVLGGASHDGIDCSGLTMVAYAAAGVSLAHYVPDQDAVGTVISAADARPGDLVVFDDEEHVGIYMGNGMVLHAPTEGRDVELDSLSDWSGIAYHYTRII